MRTFPARAGEDARGDRKKGGENNQARDEKEARLIVQ